MADDSENAVSVLQRLMRNCIAKGNANETYDGNNMIAAKKTGGEECVT